MQKKCNFIFPEIIGTIHFKISKYSQKVQVSLNILFSFNPKIQILVPKGTMWTIRLEGIGGSALMDAKYE